MTELVPGLPVCPTCGVLFANANAVMGDWRCLPQTVIFTCCNPKCADCDEDFEYQVVARLELCRKGNE